MQRRSLFFAVLALGVGSWLAAPRLQAQPAKLKTLVEPLGQSSRLTSLVVSEIMYHPADRTDGKKLEFVELYNSAPTPQDLTGYRLSGDVDYSFPAGTTIKGGGFLVVARNPGDLQSVYGLTGILGPFQSTNGLPNSKGTMRLRNRVGAIFLEVQYGTQPPWSAAADGAGHSLVLTRPSYGESDVRAWAASDAIGGSPGSADPVTASPLRSVVINEFLAHTDDPELDYIELYNHSNEVVDLSGCVLSDDAATNKFVIPAQTRIEPRGYVTFNQTEMHFSLNAAGETIYFKDPGLTRVLDAVRFGAQENGVSMGRYPDGGSEIYRLQNKTLGAPNSAIRVSDVVINELMYAPISGDDDDQYVELYNRGPSPVDLSGWRLEDGISFAFPAPTILQPDAYLVVARKAARLLAHYSNLTPANTLGDFEGKLAGAGERIALSKSDLILSTNQQGAVETNLIHIVVDEVTYRNGGRWGHWSRGGGSSLERIDARADGRLAANWADSDESTKAPWTPMAFTGRLDNGTVSADQLQVVMQGAGECLVDDVQVLNAQGANLIANTSFETDASGWTAEGTQDQSQWESAEGASGSHSYHIRAADRGDNQVNRIRTPLTSILSANTTATIQAKVRWLKGQPGVLFRLRGNWLEAVGAMELPSNLGTPGARNSRAVPHAPPLLSDVGHWPILPAAGQSAVVTARASDPDGISSVILRYRVDPGSSITAVPMLDDGTGGDELAGDGVYSATIPGQAAGTLVAFSVQAADGAAQSTSATFPNDAPARECLVRFGETTPSGSFPVYRIWMTQATFNTWTQRHKLNNTPLDVTFVLGGQRVIYNSSALYAGSPYIAPGYSTPTGNRCGYSLTFPADDRFLGNEDLVLDWPGGHGGENTALQEEMAYWIAEQMGLPYSHRYIIRLHVNGVTDMQRGGVFEAVNQPAGDFIRAWSPDDKDGDFYKIERAFEFSDGGGMVADPQPRLENYTTTGGAKKTARYRWTFLKRSTDDVNDYSNVFHLVDALNASSPEPYTSQTEALVDLEEWMGILATEHIIVNFDAYGHEIGKNMYAYKPQHGKWQLYMFDLDWLMLAAAGRRSSYGASSAPLFNAEDPTMVRMYNHPPFLRAYYRAVKKAVDGPLQSANCDPTMDAKYQALVANGVTLCDGQALASPTAVKNWFSQRRTALAAQLNTVAAPFAVTSNNGNSFETNSDTVTLTGTAPIEVKTLRVNGQEYPVTWTTVTSWSLRLVLAPGINQLVIEGLDTSGQPLANDRVAMSITSTLQPVSPVGQIVINEIMYRPAVPDAQFIELFNRSATSTFDLSHWKLAGVDFTFPEGSLIGPGAYLVVAKDRGAFTAAYGSGIPLAGEFSGKLDPDGETLSLKAPGTASADPAVVSAVRYEPDLPWPHTDEGASLQLIDPAQENARLANWRVGQASSASNPAPQWQYVTATGTASTSRLYLYLGSAGEVYVDDLKLVAGTTPEAGVNLISDGDFDSGFPGPWTVSGNLSASELNSAVKHSGNSSLHVVSSAAGASQSTAIWQDLGPLETNATYTLSYWYLPNTNGSSLTLRLSGSGISSTRNIAPNEAPPTTPATPGAINSVRATLPVLPPLWINEIQPDNTTGIVNESGQHAPWLEIYNAGDSSVSLNGWYLTQSMTNLTEWPFPTDAAIGPGQHLLIWLDGASQPTQWPTLHSSFRVAVADGFLGLVGPLGSAPMLLDYIKYRSLGTDYSAGLFPDGQPGDQHVFDLATPGATNIEPGTQIRITGIVASAEGMLIGWRSQPGQTYRVQSKDELAAPAWTDRADVPSSGSVTSWIAPTGVRSHQFYRIQALSEQ